MLPALDTEPEPEAPPDPYEDFMLQHLRYYGYFKDRKGSLPNPARNPRVWRNSPRHLLNRPLVPSEHQEKLLWPRCLSSSQQWWRAAVSRDAHLRSQQLLYDAPGEATPRLREPRDLFGFLSRGGPQEAPRWPVECEVIKEPVRHIEWVPPYPEYFYQPTGNEKLPEIVGEEKGTVVYQLDSAPREESFFTGSRVGGRRGAIKQLAVTLEGPEDETLLFESRFESGNLERAVRVGTHEYELTLRTDLYTSKHTQWFYFRVQNTRRAPVYRFTIVNLLKPKSLYRAGMKPLLYSQADAQGHGVGWRREGGDICYYRRPGEDGQRPLYCLTWTVRFPHDGDTCYLAHFYPYTYSDLQRYLLAVALSPEQARFCRLRTLCRSLAGNAVYLLTITNPARSAQEAAAKRAVVLSARVHPGESNGSWVMSGFLDFILGGSADAQLLRDVFVFKVIPMLNPDGVIVGNYRCSLAGRDLNRHYKTALKDSLPCIWYTRNMIKRLLEEREVLLYCDFHGHSRKHNVFLYGCSSSDRKFWLHERVLPFMLSKNAPDKFSFHSCNFKVQKCKAGTGRVAVWRMGVRNSYTLEATFGGSTLGSKRDTHFTTEDLKSLGHLVCDTLLDFCDPDQTKFTRCLAELRNLLQQKIHRKLRELGRDPSEADWSDASLSDLESSTSGSDSSLSDWPPVRQLNPAHQRRKASKKKKRSLPTRRQRDEQYQKNATMRRLKLPARVVHPTGLQKVPACLSQPQDASAAATRSEKPRLSECQTRLRVSSNRHSVCSAGPSAGLRVHESTKSQLNGRDKATFQDPSTESASVLTKSQERMPQKPGPTRPLSPERSADRRQKPDPALQAHQPRGQCHLPSRGRRAMVVYPALHICTYP